MKRYFGIIATSRVDRAGQRIAAEALDQMVKSRQGRYIPVRLEHDVWRPPVGRCFDANLRDLSDGHVAVHAEFEIFEQADSRGSIPRRDLSYVPFVIETDVAVLLDGALRDELDDRLVIELEQTIGSRGSVQRHIKKHLLGPIDITLIVGGFFAAEIARGILAKIGEDAYLAIKSAFARYFALRASNPRLDYSVIVCQGDKKCLVHLLFKDAAGAIAADLLLRVEALLEKELETRRIFDEDIVELVFAVDGDELRLLYGIRSDCIPFPLSALPDFDPARLSGLSIGATSPYCAPP